jgi:hypothetical protein
MQCIDMGTLEGMPGLEHCVILPKEDRQALSVMAEILSADKPDVVDDDEEYNVRVDESES